MMYRNRKLLDFARGQDCQFCNRNDGSVVAAHSNQGAHGKGLGIKAHDVFIAYLCHSCHTFVDSDSRASNEERTMVWDTAFIRSIPLFQHLLDKAGLAVLRAGA